MRRIFSLCFVLFSGFQAFAQPDYFYPEGGSFNPQIPTPEQFSRYLVWNQQVIFKCVVLWRKYDGSGYGGGVESPQPMPPGAELVVMRCVKVAKRNGFSLGVSAVFDLFLPGSCLFSFSPFT